MRQLLTPSWFVWAVLCLAPLVSGQETTVSTLPDYVKADGVSGTITSKGSDTMNNLMVLWGEGFRTFYPNVRSEVEGKGSSTAPTALIEGTVMFGPMSREMKDSEVDAFEQKFGYKPIALPVAIDMLAVYVHKDNPIEGLSLAQVDAIFSKTRRLGLESEIRTWGQLKLTGAYASRPISLYGRNSASGTYVYFKDHALGGGDFKATVKEQPGSAGVVGAIAKDKFALGYSGIGYLTSDVKAVPLMPEDGDAFVAATPDNAYSGEYPLARYLYVYVNYKPGSDLDPLRREFIRFLYSKQGQEIVAKDGYLPLPSDGAAAALESVGMTP